MVSLTWNKNLNTPEVFQISEWTEDTICLYGILLCECSMFKGEKKWTYSNKLKNNVLGKNSPTCLLICKDRSIIKVEASKIPNRPHFPIWTCPGAAISWRRSPVHSTNRYRNMGGYSLCGCHQIMRCSPKGDTPYLFIDGILLLD